MDRILDLLASSGPRATGRLYAELFPANEITRNDFEQILGAVVRSGLLSQTEATFEKDGKRIPYRTVRLPAGSRSSGENGPIEFVMKDAGLPSGITGVKKRKGRAKSKRVRGRQAGQVSDKARREAPESSSTEGKLEQELKNWRLKEAKRRSVPAFRIFTDRVLKNLVADTPQSVNQLSSISGVSTNLVKQYGNQICAVIRQHLS